MPADWWTFPEALAVDDSDILIVKRQWGAFYGTDLEMQLRRRGITTLVLGGIATNIGVESTARAAWERGFELIIAEDMCSAPNAEMHRFAFENIFPRLARVRSTGEILAALQVAR
ncbi:Isochorismatase family protein yecD [Serratia odorifera]|uniref:Isochorismatase family protein yecD n=1 Tax=Serratia odorifera TaxID=618 RepID=A0A3S4E4S5_SEROD|nr:Isochorismatase family protein yecD [Serratia odorifera]